MRTTFFAALAMLSLVVVNPKAHSGWLPLGGAAGALAGHMAGHGVLGAAGGCIAGHEWHKHQLRQQDLQNQKAYNTRRQSDDPNYKNPWNQ